MEPSGWSSSILASGRPEELQTRLALWPMAVDIDAPVCEGESTLMRACRRTDKEGQRMVEILLEHGADPDKGLFDPSEEPQWIADWAEEFEDDLYAPSLDRVAAKRQAVETRASGRTVAALEHALRTWASTPNAPVEEGGELLLAGAGINSTGEESGGRTALILACERGFVRQVRLLLSKGADPGQCSNEGPTHSPLRHAYMGKINPRMVSDASDHDAVIHMLKSKGQRLSSSDEAWFRQRDAQGSAPVLAGARRSGDVEGISAAPPAQRPRTVASVAPARSNGGWGAIAEQTLRSSREPWEDLEGKLYKRFPNDVWACLVCAQCKPMTGRAAFVTHIEGRKHHQVTVGSAYGGSGGGRAPYERGVPANDPMRRLTEQMHSDMLMRQDAQMRQSSHEARINQTAGGSGDMESALPGAAMGGRETQAYWRHQQKKMAERELLRREALEKQIRAKEAEEMRMVRRNRDLEDRLAHYETTRRECREQSAELLRQQGFIEELKRQLARAKVEATEQRASVEEVSGRLNALTIERVRDGEELQRLRTDLYEKTNLVQLQNEMLSRARVELMNAQQRELDQVSTNLSQVSIAGDAETRARVMHLEHELDQAKSSKVTLTNRLRVANAEKASALCQCQETQEAHNRLTGAHTKLKKVLAESVNDRREAESQRKNALVRCDELERQLVDHKSGLQQERRQRKAAEDELDRLRHEGHGKDYSEALRTAAETIAEVFREEDGPEAKRAARDQLLGTLPGRGDAAGSNAVARGLVNFAELLEMLWSFESASRMVQEMSDQKRSVQAVQDAAVKAMNQSDHWKLPLRRLGTLDAEAVYESLDRRPGRRFNHSQKRRILDELERAGAGCTLIKNPVYSRNALGENEFIEVKIQPPLETRRNGEVTVDREHRELVRIKEDYGEGARDAVIRCYSEQLKFNSSGGYAVTKIMDSKTGEEMQPGRIVECMAVWRPGHMQVLCFSAPDFLASPASAVWRTFHVADNSAKINRILQQQGLLADDRGDAEIYLKPVGESSSSSSVDELRQQGETLGDIGVDELLEQEETLGDRIDAGTDIVAGKLQRFVLVANPR